MTKKKKGKKHYPFPDLSSLETKHGELHPGCGGGGASSPIPDLPPTALPELCTPVPNIETPWN